MAQTGSVRPSFLRRLMGQSWELSLPQLASMTAGIVLLVSLATVVGLRRFGTDGPRPLTQVEASNSSNDDRIFQRSQLINYWSERVQQNKARWSPEMREKFDRNMRAIDDAVANSLDELNRNPHDEFYEQMLNVSLNDKLEMLKDFSDL
jgi:hypothetical protein